MTTTAQKRKSTVQKGVIVQKDKNHLTKRSQVSGRGFSSMSHDKVVEISKKGGQARAEQIDHKGGEAKISKNREKRWKIREIT